MRKYAALILSTLLALSGAAHSQVVPWPPTAGLTGILCAYNTSPPTIPNGQIALVQCDNQGRLLTTSTNVPDNTPPGGDNGEVQFNSNGVFGGSPNLTFGALTGTLLLAQGTNNVNAPSLVFRNTTGQSVTITVPLSTPLNSHNIFLPPVTADDTFATLGTTQTFTATQTISLPNLGLSGNGGLIESNPTPATSGGGDQVSPRIQLIGNSWAAIPAASQTLEFDWQVRPIDGTTTAAGNLVLLSKLNGGAETQLAAFRQDGYLFATAGLETNGPISGASLSGTPSGPLAINASTGQTVALGVNTTTYMNAGSTGLIPASNNAINLGSPSLAFLNGYISQVFASNYTVGSDPGVSCEGSPSPNFTVEFGIVIRC